MQYPSRIEVEVLRLGLGEYTPYGAGCAGSSRWTLAIPNTPALAGITLLQQGFVFDAPGNALGIVTSNGARLTVGA